jgi:hypothetical protein
MKARHNLLAALLVSLFSPLEPFFTKAAERERVGEVAKEFS